MAVPSPGGAFMSHLEDGVTTLLMGQSVRGEGAPALPHGC